MPDKKLTDSEIVKALMCCTKGLECKNCPANPHKGNYGYCTGLLLKDTLDLINRLQAEIEKWQSGYMTQKQEIANLEIELKAMRGAANSYKAENERLKNTIAIFTNNAVDFANEIDRHKKDKDDAFQLAADIVNAEKIVVVQAKAEAYKEFAERLKMRAINRYNEYDNQEFPYATITHIDNLLKELVGEDNE